MNRFEASTESTAVVPVAREKVWAVLTDPELLPRLTPFLQRIEVDGDRWTWHMSKIGVLSASITPVFTERMVFDEPTRIEYHHTPPEGVEEPAGVEGWYDLSEVDEGTRLAISLGVSVALPIAKAAGPAVRTTMKGVIATMGRKFSANLLDHLGVRRGR